MDEDDSRGMKLTTWMKWTSSSSNQMGLNAAAPLMSALQGKSPASRGKKRLRGKTKNDTQCLLCTFATNDALEIVEHLVKDHEQAIRNGEEQPFANPSADVAFCLRFMLIVRLKAGTELTEKVIRNEKAKFNSICKESDINLDGCSKLWGLLLNMFPDQPSFSDSLAAGAEDVLVAVHRKVGISFSTGQQKGKKFCVL